MSIKWQVDNPKDRPQIDPLEQCKAMAQRDANRSQATMAVLNLNTIGRAMYVVRAYRPEMEQGPYSHQFVAKFEPN